MQANKKFHVLGKTELTDEEKKEIQQSSEERGKQLLSSLDQKKEVKNKVIGVQPAPNRVLVEVHKEEVKSSIIIPEMFRKMQNKGRIVKLGLATEGKPQLYQEGDVVYFPATASIIPYEQNGQAYAIINQYDIYMKVTDEDSKITVSEPEAGMKI